MKLEILNSFLPDVYQGTPHSFRCFLQVKGIVTVLNITGMNRIVNFFHAFY